MKLFKFISDAVNANREFIVRNFALNYETRIHGESGESGKYLRAVLPTLTCFFFAIYSTLLIDNLGLWVELQSSGAFLELVFGVFLVAFYFIFWVPVLVCWWIGFPWFGAGYFELYPLKYAELKNKSQQWQMLNKPHLIGKEDETFPEGEFYTSEYKRLKVWHNDKFNNDLDVDVTLGIAPFIILVAGAIIAVAILA